MKENTKQFGILVKMPDSDPLSAAHLLGDNWLSERWFQTQEERDRMYEQMASVPTNYRKGDKPSILLTKLDP